MFEKYLKGMSIHKYDDFLVRTIFFQMLVPSLALGIGVGFFLMGPSFLFVLGILFMLGTIIWSAVV